MATTVRSLMSSNGDGSKQIWATEFGAPTCSGNSRCESEANQASHIQSGINLWKSYAWAGPLIMYRYDDTCANVADPECYFGLTRADGSVKPALAVVKNSY